MVVIFFGKGHELDKQVPANIWQISDPENILPAPKWPKPTNEKSKKSIFSKVFEI